MACSGWLCRVVRSAGAVVLAAAFLPGTVRAATIETKVMKYQFEAPFKCDSRYHRYFIDETRDNVCGEGISTLFGKWTWSPRPTAYQGAHHYISKADQTFEEWAAWSPTITVPGRYQVWADWRASHNRANRTPYYVYSDAGTFLVNVNQFIDDEAFQGVKWAWLGTFYFAARKASAAPEAGYVKVVNGPDHSEGIDAVAMRYVGPFLKASTGALKGIGLTWTAAPRSVAYEIFRGPTGAKADRVSIGKTTASTYFDVDTEPGVKTYYWVKSVDAAGKVLWSNGAAGRRLKPRS